MSCGGRDKEQIKCNKILNFYHTVAKIAVGDVLLRADRSRVRTASYRLVVFHENGRAFARDHVLRVLVVGAGRGTGKGRSWKYAYVAKGRSGLVVRSGCAQVWLVVLKCSTNSVAPTTHRVVGCCHHGPHFIHPSTRNLRITPQQAVVDQQVGRTVVRSQLLQRVPPTQQGEGPAGPSEEMREMVRVRDPPRHKHAPHVDHVRWIEGSGSPAAAPHAQPTPVVEPPPSVVEAAPDGPGGPTGF